MAVLMLFNDAELLSYEEIAAATAIPEDDLKRVLQSLACVKVGRCSYVSVRMYAAAGARAGLAQGARSHAGQDAAV